MIAFVWVIFLIESLLDLEQWSSSEFHVISQEVSSADHYLQKLERMPWAFNFMAVPTSLPFIISQVNFRQNTSKSYAKASLFTISSPNESCKHQVTWTTLDNQNCYHNLCWALFDLTYILRSPSSANTKHCTIITISSRSELGKFCRGSIRGIIKYLWTIRCDSFCNASLYSSTALWLTQWPPQLLRNRHQNEAHMKICQELCCLCVFGVLWLVKLKFGMKIFQGDEDK